MACLMLRAMWRARGGSCSRPMSWQTISSMEGVWATGQATFDGVGDAVGVFGVDGVVAVDEDDVGADVFGFADLGAGFDAEGFGLVAGGDAAGGVGHGGDDGEGFVAVLGVELLLDGGKEAVEVDVEEGEAVGLVFVRHRRVRLVYSLFVCFSQRLCDDFEGAHHVVGFVLEDVAVVEVFSGVAVEVDDDAGDHVGGALDGVFPA